MAKKENANNLNLLADFAISDIQAADNQPKQKRFDMIAYTGGAMSLGGWSNKVVIDLAGMNVGKQVKPIYIDHNTDDMSYLMGQTDSIKVKDNALHASGLVTGSSEPVKQVLDHQQNGFKWQASVGARAEKYEFIPEGKSVKCNGQDFQGPVVVVLKSTLGEISFVPLGADDNTSAQIAASGQYFDKDFITKGASMADEVKAAEAEVKAAQETKIEAKAEPVVDLMAESRKQQADELRRCSAIRAKCGTNLDLAAKAIEENWTVEKAELEALRASTPKVTGIIVSNNDVTPQVVEAAALMAGGISGDSLIKAYTGKVVDIADKQFKNRIGLQQMILEAAWAAGCPTRHFRENPRQVLEAAFSTMSLPNILSNVANKFLLTGFNSVESVWRTISAIRNVADFKAVASYRLNGGFEYDEVGPTGELKHGTVSETAYANQAKTYGKMFAITRTDLINDDLGALTGMPQKIGRGGALKLNKVFWLAFLDNAAFFTAATGSFDDGTDSALSFSALSAAETLFLEQKDVDGYPLGINPRILLVPPGLKATAEALMKSMEIRDTTANSKTPVANIHAGKFDIACSSYLSNSAMTNYSTTKWYLLADPADLPVIEVAFLNGKQEPTVETADANFNTLGIEMRGYHDFGVAKQEYRGGVAMKGTT